MTTTPIHSWNIPLSEVGPIYPFVGHEMVLVVLAVIAWISFHIWQIRHEHSVLNKQAQDILERLEADAAEEEVN